MNAPTIQCLLPQWLSEKYHEILAQATPEMDDRMALAAALADENIDQKTGGPFGALIYDMTRQRCVSVGVNLVTSRRCSLWHAEIVAIALAQQALSTYNLAQQGKFELVTTVEPCAMCLGAVGWAGVSRLVCGARDADAREIGFDEGDKPPNGVQSLITRGVEVVQDVGRVTAKAVLTRYHRENGTIY